MSSHSTVATGYAFSRGGFWLLLAPAMLLFGGCSGSSPPAVSVEDSGIEVVGDSLTWTTDDWPQWRGPRGDGIVVDRPLPTQWSESTGVAWSTDIPGRGHSSPVVHGGTVYLTTALEANQKQIVIAIDAASGDEKWQTVVHEGSFPPRGQNQHAKGSHANGSVVCDGEQVIATFFNRGKIIATALDLNGDEVWEREIGTFNGRFGYAPSPLLYRSVVIVPADQRGGGFVAALERSTGEIAWLAQRPSDFSYSSALVAQIDGRMQLVLCGCDRVIGYDPDTGDQLWSAKGTTASTCGTPVTDGRRVFASGGYPGQQTICIEAGKSADSVWTKRVKLYEPSLICVDDLVFGVTDNGVAYCWSTADGEEHWKTRLRGEFSASPIAVNGLIYVSNLRGETFVFRATDEGYDLVAKNQLGNEIYGSPAVAGSSLFIRAVHQVDGRRVERLHRIDGAESG